LARQFCRATPAIHAAAGVVSDVCSLSIPSRHIGVFIRWRVRRVGTDGRAGFFCVCTGGAGRLPGQGAVAGRSRGVVMVASALNLHLKGRRLYAGRPSAALAIRKIAGALNLHLKGRRLAQVYASYARARRRRRCSFL
jgi:hypothetical protein